MISNTIPAANKYLPALLVTVCIFFFWGFSASSNALLIPVLKQEFKLSQFESQLVEFSFYLAYFVGSVIYLVLSSKMPEWMARLTLKKLMVTGLMLSAFGTTWLIAALGSQSYVFVLCSLFLIALGFALQQIVANPLLVQLGNELTGANRLILAGAVNSFGNTIAPLVLGLFMFGAFSVNTSKMAISSLQPLYIAIGCLYLFFAILFTQIRIPDFSSLEVAGEKTGFRLKSHPKLIYGMLAIFAYVGCEVSIQSNLPALVEAPEIMGLPAEEAVHYFSIFGGSLMIGRCTGALYNFNLSNTTFRLALLIVPIAAFSIVLLANWLTGSPFTELVDYTPMLLLLSIALLISGINSSRILLVAACFSIGLLFASFLFSGKWSMYAIIGIGCFTSLMWPCIFALSVKGLGRHTRQGSSLLVMMIVGGAAIPPIQGLLADNPAIGIHASFLLPALCLLYIAWFARRFYKA